jgi:hypothetical protein
MAIDGQGDAWFTAFVGSQSLYDTLEIATTATTNCSSGCSTFNALDVGAIDSEIAVDRSGDVFISNSTASGGGLGEYFEGGAGQSVCYFTAISDQPGPLVVSNSGTLITAGVLGVYSVPPGSWSTVKVFDGGPDCGESVMFSYPNADNGGPTGFAPAAIGVDSAGNVWTTFATINNSTYIFLNASLFLTQPGNSDSKAIDGFGNVWLAFSDTNVGGPENLVLKINGSATANCGSGCTSFQIPSFPSYESLSAIAIDGAGTVWVAGDISSYLVAITANVSADCSTGCRVYTEVNGAGIGDGFLAIDGSGNIWSSSGAGSGGGVVKIPKLTAPTVTPLAAQAR